MPLAIVAKLAEQPVPQLSVLVGQALAVQVPPVIGVTQAPFVQVACASPRYPTAVLVVSAVVVPLGTPVKLAEQPETEPVQLKVDVVHGP